MPRVNTRLYSAVGLAAVLVAGTVVAFLPFWSGSRRMQTFCAGVAVGTSDAALRDMAKSAGYEVSFEATFAPADGGARGGPVSGPARVSDPRFSRFACDVQLDGLGRLVRARYNGD